MTMTTSQRTPAMPRLGIQPRRVQLAIRMLRLTLLFGVLGSPCWHVALADEADNASSSAALRILFVGNSYTNGAWNAINEVFLGESPDIVLERHTAGGATLTRWAKDEKLLERIRTGDWDFVVLQEQSQIPSLAREQVDGFYRSVASLNRTIKDSDARTVLLMDVGTARR